MASKTILVTGGAGFIGSHVAKRLGELGHTLVIVDNLNDYYDPALKRARLETLLNDVPHTFYQADIADERAMRGIFEKHAIDQICHLGAQAGVRYASQAPFVYEHSNLRGTLVLLELAREFNVSNIVMASSSSVYGDATRYPVKETATTGSPLSLYAATKRATELMAHSYHHLYGLPITCLRFFTVYGPWGRPDMAFFSFTGKVFSEKTVDIYGHGEMERDFTFIDDVADGIVRALERRLSWAVLNLGRGKAEPLMRMVELIEQTAGREMKKRYVDMQPGDVKQTWADISQARELLGWEPTVDLDKGIPKFVEWYRGYYGV